LAKYASSEQAKFIVAETVFGMDGDCLDIEPLKQMAQDHNAFVYLDEAHATGLFGENGYGLACGFKEGVVMGTFSKAIGGSGAYIACSNQVKRYLINKCTGFIYSTAPSPAAIGAATAAWKLIPQLNKQRTYIQHLGTTLRQACQGLGLNTGLSSTHIIPIVVGSEENAISLKKHLLNNGLLSSAIRPPTVPPNTARVRITLASTHTEENITRLISALESWKPTAPL
jgi:8-amino-7-oxononanoate synthase